MTYFQANCFNPNAGGFEGYNLTGPDFVGPLLIATLAYPEPEHHKKRFKFMFRLWDGDTSLFGKSRQVLRPSDLETRLRHRLDAGHVGLARFKQTMGRSEAETAELRPMSLQAATQIDDLAALESFRKRGFSQSQPVMHLAMSFAEISRRERLRDPRWTIVDLLCSPNLVGEMIRRSWDFEPFLQTPLGGSMSSQSLFRISI